MSLRATRSIHFSAYSTLCSGSQLRWTPCPTSPIRALATLVDATKVEAAQNESYSQVLNIDTQPIIKALPLYSPTVEAFLRSFRGNRPVGILPLPRTIFAHPLRTDILHRVVTWQLNNMRQGTGSSKGRSDVRGSTRKIQPQKGTGKARHGSIRAPQFRGGGKAFGPKPRDFSADLPAQVVTMGMRVALSTKYAQNQLVVVRDMLLESHKTKIMVMLIKRNRWKNALFVTAADGNINLERSVKNILGVNIMVWDEVTCYDIMRFENLVIEKDALKSLADTLKVEQSPDDEFLLAKALTAPNIVK